MRFSIAACIVLLALGAPTFAKEAAPPKDHKEGAAVSPTAPADAHGHELKKSGGLDFTGIKRYDLGIYTLIVFGILLFVLNKFAWPHISAGLKKREAAIIGARDEAAKAKQEAEELRAKLQKDYAEAQDKIRAMLDEARRDSEALRATEREAGAKEAQAERDRARREIQTEKEAVLQELYQQAVQLASTMSAKTIRRSLGADDHRRLLDESLAEIRSTIKA